MRLKYVGPKPEITPNEIYFKEAKEDKYVYIQIVMQLIEALDNASSSSSIKFSFRENRFSDRELEEIIIKHDEDFEEEFNQSVIEYQKELDDKIEKIKNSNRPEDEKKSYIKNYEIMRDYLVQREKNKFFYEKAIDILASIIKHKNVKKIILPFFEKSHHISKSLAAHLKQSKSPLYTTTRIEKDSEGLKIELSFSEFMPN
jgi:hypothetical protein